MDTLIGVLVDVSGSMKSSIGDTNTSRGGEWARTNFELIDNLIKYDVSPRNHVFALGFGAKYEPKIFDLLNTIEKSKTECVSANLGHRDTLEMILYILENNGAPRVRKWGKMNVLLSVVEETDAKLFLDRLTCDYEFTKCFVKDCLPEECRNINVTSLGGIGGELAYSAIGGIKCVTEIFGSNPISRSAERKQESVTEDSVKEVVEKGKKLLAERVFARISAGAVMNVHRAREILHGSVRKEDLTDQRVDELMKQVRPFIYDGTPLMETLRAAVHLFGMWGFEDYEKLLYILSDGEPTDGTSPPTTELTALGVKTVSCYITNNNISDPKRLYSISSYSWDDATKLMFKMSSTVPAQQIPRTLFIKRGWTIDTENNETRLFVQANHPDIIKEACDLARDVFCCQDALSELLSSISLDQYINQANDGFGPQLQHGGTCYAYATATVLHLAMKRIVGREGGYPDFVELRDKIIGKYGECGANTLRVLKEVCPKYRLRYQKVDDKGALKAVAAKRPVVARYKWTDDEKRTFLDFFRAHPRGTLSRSDLNIRRPAREDLGGHAVVLTSYDRQGLRLMNSWGHTWADGGFFRVSDANVLDIEFFDVYWEISDLKPSEISAYDAHGPAIAQTLMSTLKGLQKKQYKCPLCHGKSGLAEFSGHALATVCPKCSKTFKIVNPGDDLALNLYLLSLSA